MGFGICEKCGGYWCSVGDYVNYCVCKPVAPAPQPPADATPTYEDGEGRPAPLKPARLISAKPIKTAEQAQGGGAPTCTCGSGAHPRRCETHPWAFGQHVEELSREALADDVSELSKLVTQLQDGCTESGARRATETAALAKRVEAIDKRVAEENEEMLDAFLKALDAATCAKRKRK